MGRPKKNCSTPEARQRIINALWELLEDASLSDLTVGIISSKACCNRGTFYYHFANLDSLVHAAIEEELLGPNGLSNDIFALLHGVDKEAITNILPRKRVERFSLIMKHGGSDTVSKETKSILLGMWQAVLCPDGSEISPEARIIIEYAISGMFGLLSFVGQKDMDFERDALLSFCDTFASEIASVTLSQICAAQNIPKSEVLTRLNMLNQFIQLQKD